MVPTTSNNLLDLSPADLPADVHLSSTPREALLTTLHSSSHIFLEPPLSLHEASLALAKSYLDPLATSTSEKQVERQQISRRKRKRGELNHRDPQKPLGLKQIYLNGLEIDQIWEQARRILDAGRREIEFSLPAEPKEQETAYLSSSTSKGPTKTSKSVNYVDFDEDGLALNISDASDAKAEEVVSIGEVDGALEDLDQSCSDDQDIAIGDYQVGDIIEQDDIVDDEYGNLSDSEFNSRLKDIFVPDKHGLNDGFFSIDDFNRHSEFLELQAAKGEDDRAASDEEDVDWDADPLVTSFPHIEGQSREEQIAEESEDEVEGPTFGNVELNAPYLSESADASDTGADMEVPGAMNNTNEIKYADFFAPPPRKASKPTRRRALPKTQPSSSSAAPKQETEDDDIQRTVSAVRRDLFEDDLTPNEDEAPSEPDERRSSHQTRQAALTAEIRRLEAAAVAKRYWTLSGEARAVDRPVNSLLEEDLEFERAGKPIPVITQEVSEDIEALIKRRILAREFDEVIRRRPGKLATGSGDVRRGRFELEDTKPQQSLAELYEAEHLKTVDPGGYVDKRDEKLKREHAEIEHMWKDVSAKLDALSSWHYRPKPPSASINVITDVPKISMEDARPAAGGEVGGESMLAPQEVYRPSDEKPSKDEVLKKVSGLPIAREEMTREEKVRRRRREKERIRKAGGLKSKPLEGRSGKVEAKRGVMKDLKKGGVRVIGKKGEIRDVEGLTVKTKISTGKGAGGYKL